MLDISATVPAWAQTPPTTTAPPTANKPANLGRPAKPLAFRRQYTVFFAQGSASLMPGAASIVKTASEAAKQRRYSHLKVIGYSDATGTAASAKSLSQARAAAVREALVAAGIPGDKIRIEGRGKSNPAISTPNPEPRNRRARIVIYLPGE
ncbi:MAG TPA: OmpA family protein [Stellaceae bacterium]|nr:OmpA family protein [Stellaceae bacterium]